MIDPGFPDASELVDPRVDVHLVTGRVITLHDVSIVELAKRLHHWGYLYISDGAGEYAVFFKHGVAALTAGARDNSHNS